ncbi:hypothetical protein HXW87_20670 [Pseudomonas sp. Y5-11]|uniref:hypothetical protein n=1 Tax=Pseudomonas sp. Y5-11 TaxID=2749808 RepID=UPI001EFBF8EE|nr:hypothetical protein [Pseudomonas sp. Y5-11]ULN84496.1 hypothetical protein HXW87_20670 [Pseudomonas sp. Y5-11]
MPYAITSYGWRAVGEGFTDADLAEGESLVEEIPQSLIDAIAAQDLLRETTADLNARTRLATAQVTACRVESMQSTTPLTAITLCRRRLKRSPIEWQCWPSGKSTGCFSAA